MIISDTITKNREFQQHHKERAEHLIKLGAPKVIIEREIELSKMTLAEYQIESKKEIEEIKKINSEYAKNHPLQKNVIDSIYKFYEEQEWDSKYVHNGFGFYLVREKIISEVDATHGLYDDIVKHVNALYFERYKAEMEEYKKSFE